MVKKIDHLGITVENYDEIKNLMFDLCIVRVKNTSIFVKFFSSSRLCVCSLYDLADANVFNCDCSAGRHLHGSLANRTGYCGCCFYLQHDRLYWSNGSD